MLSPVWSPLRAVRYPIGSPAWSSVWPPVKSPCWFPMWLPIGSPVALRQWLLHPGLGFLPWRWFGRLGLYLTLSFPLGLVYVACVTAAGCVLVVAPCLVLLVLAALAAHCLSPSPVSCASLVWLTRMWGLQCVMLLCRPVPLPLPCILWPLWAPGGSGLCVPRGMVLSSVPCTRFFLGGHRVLGGL